MISNRFVLLVAALAACCEFASAQEIYVSPTGSDKNPGTSKQPVASFAKAQELARKHKGGSTLEVIFKKGTYYLDNPIVFTSTDNPGGARKVVYRAENEGEVVLSGGMFINLRWKPYSKEKGIYVASVKDDIAIDQLYINGARQRMARFPNAEEGKNVFDVWNLNEGSDYANHDAMNRMDASENPLDPKRVARWKNPEGGYLHAMHSSLWGDMHWLITGKKSDTTLSTVGGWQNNRPAPMHNKFRMVENIFEELDAPGEWFFDHNAKLLYYIPAAGVSITKAKVEVVRLKNIISFKGTEQNPATNINLSGFVFRHVARTFMDNKEPLGRSDWTVYRGGAVLYDGATGCSISDCEFDQVGGNTIFVNGYNRGIKITGCYIHNSGANGVAFVGESSSFRSYLVGYVNQDYAKLDTVAGPANNRYPADCIVEDCIITKTGRDEKQTAGVQISLAAGITIRHCSIYDVPRAGINIGEGAFGGHTIEGCDVFNTVLETGDHGSFNSWGRDRYWTPDIRKTAEEVAKRPAMTSWDMIAPNTIRNSRWRCDYGWDIDLDDGSSNYIIYNNLLLNRGLKLREGYNRTAENNIIVNNSLHPHVWYPNSGDVFTRNIVYSAYKPAIMNAGIASDGKWGKLVDRNLFACSEDQMRKFARNGCDSSSVVGDPMFVNPAAGDFTLKDGSPAFALGFKNFDMNSFGVQKPRLKAIAKQPVMPTVAVYTAAKRSESASAATMFWYGAELYSPKGDELSAFGAGYADGGVAIYRTPAGATIGKLGLREGVLIQSINGVKIKSADDLAAYIKAHGGEGMHKIVFLQNQKKSEAAIAGKLEEVVVNK